MTHPSAFLHALQKGEPFLVGASAIEIYPPIKKACRMPGMPHLIIGCGQAADLLPLEPALQTSAGTDLKTMNAMCTFLSFYNIMT